MMYGEKLRKLRKDNQLTQKQLAEKLNMSHSTIANYESEDREPSIAIMNKLTRFFGVTLNDVFMEEKDDIRI